LKGEIDEDGINVKWVELLYAVVAIVEEEKITRL
jgi:hypothetical protein